MAVNGLKNVRCPFCYSSNVEQETSSKMVHAAKGVAAFGVAVIGSFTVGHGMGGKAMNGMLEEGAYDFVCNHCGRQFVVEFKNNTVTDVRAHR